MATVKPEVLAQLNPNVILYPCKYFGNGILPLPKSKGISINMAKRSYAQRWIWAWPPCVVALA